MSEEDDAPELIWGLGEEEEVTLLDPDGAFPTLQQALETALTHIRTAPPPANHVSDLPPVAEEDVLFEQAAPSAPPEAAPRTEMEGYRPLQAPPSWLSWHLARLMILLRRLFPRL